ncbi:glycosyltransferase family 39 protein [bacterium]|nr:glycosyltransferase family 39 protein [bacterium]
MLGKNIHLRYAIFSVAVIAGILFFCGLDEGMRDWDEGVYAQVAKEMHLRNDWLTPYYSGKPFIDKPPLLMWCTMLSYRIFGIGVWQARLTTYIASIALLILTMLFAAKTISPHAGALTGLFLLGMPHFVKEAKMGHLEQIVSLFLTFSLISFWYARTKKTAAVWCGIAAGLAFLTKWVVGLCAPIVQIIVIAAGIQRTLLKNKWWWIGYAIGISIAAPWFIYHYSAFPAQFMDTYFGRMIVESITEGVNDHTGPFYYYVAVLIKKARPWGVLLLPLTAYLGYRTAKRDSFGTFLFVWLSVFLVIFSFSTTKIHRYIVILYPVFALGLSYAVQRISVLSNRYTLIMLTALLIIALHCIISKDFLKSDYHHTLQHVLKASAGDIAQTAEIYVYGSTKTYKPTLLFFTEKTIKKLSSTDELLATVAHHEKIFLIVKSPDDHEIYALLESGACAESKPAYNAGNLTVFFLKKSQSIGK